MHLGYIPTLTSRLRAFWRVALMCFACLFITLTSVTVQARSILELDAARQPIALGDWGEYWIDSGSERGPDQVDASNALSWLRERFCSAVAQPASGREAVTAAAFAGVRFFS